MTGWRVPPLQGSVAGTHPLAEHSTIVRSRNRKFISKLPPPLTQLLSARDLCTPAAARARLLEIDMYDVVINILCIYSTQYIYFISTLYLHIYLETGVTAGELLPLEGIIRSRHTGAWAAHSDIRRAVEMADIGKCFCLFQDNRREESAKIT